MTSSTDSIIRHRLQQGRSLPSKSTPGLSKEALGLRTIGQQLVQKTKNRRRWDSGKGNHNRTNTCPDKIHQTQ